MERSARVERETEETKIAIELKIDGGKKSRISTGVSFFDHMLYLMAKHGFFDLSIEARGDIEVDFHHTVEDVGIVLGEALKKALGDRVGIRRYGSATVPMGDALASVVVDICNRPFLVYNVSLAEGKVGNFDLELVKEFFQAFASHSGITLHVNLMYGSNNHHMIEAVFKAFGRALDEASILDEKISGILSTKGRL